MYIFFECWMSCVGFLSSYGVSQFGISADEYEVRLYAGFISSYGIAFFGASKNEERVCPFNSK